MAKGKVKKGKNDRPKTSGRVTRSQRRAMERSLSNVGLEDLDTQLRNLGLCTKNITGDGNCLFRALSDQYYGQDSKHREIRQEVCQFLRENEENYKFFVEDDQSFEHHVECMSQDATYGGNMELAAFAKMKEVDIKVYQPGMIYIINGKEGTEEDDDVQVLHIAYHSWEHYSSVRNIDGPITGPPEIKVNNGTVDNEVTPEGDEKDEIDQDLNSKEKMILTACPGTNIRKVRRLLIKNKGDPNKVIDALYEEAAAPENPKDEDAKEDSLPVLEDLPKDVPVEEVDIVAPATTVPHEEVLHVETQETTSDEKDHAIEADKETEETVEETNEEVMDANDKEDTQPTKLKKLPARERKKEQKRKQKEKQLQKAQEKAARKLQRTQQNDGDDAVKDTSVKTGASQSMKEMYI